MAGLVDWLPVWNMALRRVGAGELPAGVDIATNPAPEAKTIYRFWDNLLERVLGDHDWKVATKTVFLGSSTTAFTPILPQGLTEYASGKLTRYFLPIPSFDPTGVAAGSITTEIVRLLDLTLQGDYVPEENKLFFDTAILDTNVYGRFITKPDYAAAKRDGNLIDALKTGLALLISSPLSAKDAARDQMLMHEYQTAISTARFRDNTTGDSSVQGQQFWFEQIAGTGRGSGPAQ